ncbi:MAG: DUF4870 domain-containing protein [Lentisphaerae bacterium]|jgi:uncharacterized protein|nr:DUF4870 domain-containing protein [Lentisphaerota bacterium]MBT4815676.1 DUF4870 domain-containing protein [Lentisphaerota bacterium]MBT5612890.1 DUF4870 domain-containing protein [Lentisphaerota bacterium]MBT7060964.1 DUF4870 domain-containing protein [Lentisphaerota bacterium]MBT7846989.1 DUF4870 domain-containing protein [Lentisphaerota bacterium]
MENRTDERAEKLRLWAMGCHLASLACYLGIPFGNVIGPLIVWLVGKERYPEIEHDGKESLNFQISLTIYSLVAGALCLVFIGMLILPVVLIFGIVQVILATIEASKGNTYTYPYSIRFIR